MERRRREENNDFHGSGDVFGGFGSHRSMISSLFGRRDPFNDPFFTRPFGSMFGTCDSSRMNVFNSRADQAGDEPVIVELNSDDEANGDDINAEGKKANDSKTRYGRITEPSVEHPDDKDTDDDEKEEKCVNDASKRVEDTRPKTQSYSFSKVTYGGINGAYRTSSINRRMGNDGIIVEERKDADVTTGQAEHRVSKAIHDKGHSVTRKLDANGRVETMQTLHNLKEDELARFEETWKGNANMHLPGWPGESFNLRENRGTGSSGHQERQGLFRGLALPSIERAGSGRTTGTNNGSARTNSSSGRSKNIITIPID